MLFGILFGVLTAFFQDMGYTFSRIYMQKQNDARALLVDSQILMGAFSFLILPFLFVFGMPTSGEFLLPLALTCLGSGAGQYFLFRAEHKMETSRVSAMMGARVVLLAVISSLIWGDHYGWLQWSGILLAALSAVVMNWENGHFRLCGLRSMGISLGFYCLSDLSVRHMILGFGCKSVILGSLFALCAVNILTGAVLAFLRRGTWRASSFLPAAPYSAVWTAKQFCLYFCYVLIGPVHANVVFSVRGPMAVGLSLLMIRMHSTHADKPVGTWIWVQRFFATLMMMGGIVLYSVGV